MANTKYYLADNYPHYRLGMLPEKKKLDSFPVCPWCGASIVVDDHRREWICINPNCRLC